VRQVRQARSGPRPFAALAAAALATAALASCVAWRTANVPRVPRPATAEPPAVRWTVGYRLAEWEAFDELPDDFGDFGAPAGKERSPNAGRVVEELEACGWFAGVARGLDEGELRLDLCLGRRPHASYAIASLCSATLALLPGWGFDAWSIEARAETPDGRVRTYLFEDEAFVLIWVGALPLWPLLPDSRAEEAMVRGLVRRVLWAVRRDGLLEAAGAPAGATGPG